MVNEYLDEYGPATPYTLDQQGNKVFKVNPYGDTNVSINEQFSDDISLFLAQELDSATVIAPAPSLNDESVNIQTSGVTPVAGNFLCLKSGVRFLQVEIMTVTPISGNDYTLDLSMPLDFAFPVGASCSIQNVNMNVNGSVTPVTFKINPIGLDVGQKWDITRIIPTMVFSLSPGDDGLFGNLPELANGVSYRIEDSDSRTKNLFNARTNGDFANEGFDVVYPSRSGGLGDYGMRSRITFSGQDKRGVVKRLEVHSEIEADGFVATVRDDLSTLNRYRTKIQGHVVE